MTTHREKLKTIKKLKAMNEMFEWCLDQAMARRDGTLSQKKIKELDEVGFRWKYYEAYADGLIDSARRTNKNRQ